MRGLKRNLNDTALTSDAVCTGHVKFNFVICNIVRARAARAIEIIVNLHSSMTICGHVDRQFSVNCPKGQSSTEKDTVYQFLHRKVGTNQSERAGQGPVCTKLDKPDARHATLEILIKLKTRRAKKFDGLFERKKLV